MESYTSWTKWLRNMLAVLYYKSNQKDFKVHKTINRNVTNIFSLSYPKMGKRTVS